MADPLTLAILRTLGQARKQNPLAGFVPERVFVGALCPLAALPAGTARPGAVVAERLALEEALSALRESGAAAYADGCYRLTRVGNIALAIAEAETRNRFRRHGES